MKKKVMSLVLATSMAVSILSGCGSTAATGSSGSTGSTAVASTAGNTAAGSTAAGSTAAGSTAAGSTAAGSTATSGSGYTIGVNCFGSSSYALLTLSNNSKKVFSVYGDKTTVSDDNYQVDKIVQDIENMIAKGVNGLCIWLPADSLYEQVAKTCEENKVPFVLVDKIPTDPKIAKEIKSNPYFVGAVSPANDVYGDQIAKYALKQGFKSCIISSSSVGDPSDTPRLEAFEKTFKAAGGTIADELHADAADAAQGQIEDSLVAHPDVDFIYGVGSDFGEAACSVLKNQGNTKIKVMTSGLDSQAVDYLSNGQLELLSGDNWESGILAAVMLENYLDGKPLKDANGNVPYITDIQPFTLTSKQCTLFKKVFISNFCYTNDELKNMRTKNNPNFNYDAFIAASKSFSFEERAKALSSAGVVTKDELSAAGLN